MSTIITLSDFKNYIGTQDINDDRATQIIAGINQWVESYTGRIWGEVREVNDDLDFEPVVFLSHIDITQVKEVKLFGTTLTEDEYKVDKVTGRLLLSKLAERKYSRDYFNQVQVKYMSGNGTVPLDLKDAVLKLTADNYNRRDDKDANVTSERLGSYSVSYGGSASTSESGSSNSANPANGLNSVMNVLNYYRIGRF